MTIRVEGLRELDQALAELSKGAARSTVRKALMAAGQPLAAAMAARAPVRTRELVGSIGVAGKRSGKARRGRGERHVVRVYVGATGVTQAHLQEFGTVRHPPKPWARPAWDADKPRIVPRIVAHLKPGIAAAIERARAKAARKAGNS